MLPTGDHSETHAPSGSRNTSKKKHGRTAARALVASLSTVSIIGMGSAAAPAASAVDLSSLSDAINDLGFPGSPDLGRFLNSGGGDEQAQSPTLTLDKDKDISGGDTLKATGKGYKPGESIYVTQTIEKPASGYPKTYGKAVKVKADDQGNFTTDLTVDTKFRDVDCTTTRAMSRHSPHSRSFSTAPRMRGHPLASVTEAQSLLTPRAVTTAMVAATTNTLARMMAAIPSQTPAPWAAHQAVEQLSQ